MLASQQSLGHDTEPSGNMNEQLVLWILTGCLMLFNKSILVNSWKFDVLYKIAFNKKVNKLYVLLEESRSLDVCFCSSSDFLPCLNKEDGFQRRNWEPQIELRAEKGHYFKLLPEECDLDSGNTVHLSTDVWKVIILSQNNSFKYRFSVRMYVMFFTGCCKGKQCAVVKFLCMVKVFFPLLRCLLRKGDVQTETNGKALIHPWMNVHSLSFRLSVCKAV